MVGVQVKTSATAPSEWEFHPVAASTPALEVNLAEDHGRIVRTSEAIAVETRETR